MALQAPRHQQKFVPANEWQTKEEQIKALQEKATKAQWQQWL
jgi:hypothetical protein